jgi:2-keto-3-deoxy-L-fuconate dehydrogenase
LSIGNLVANQKNQQELSVVGGDHMNRLNGKVAFLTAAAAGIGRATALAFAAEGARVIATDRDAKALESLARGLSIISSGHKTFALNVASLASSLKGFPNRLAYTMSKAAVIGLSKSIAMDYIKNGIRVNTICPGTVDSPSLHNRAAGTGDKAKSMLNYIARQPIGRLGRPEEIAAVAVYLAGDESGYTTGTDILVDGGIRL